ncbi:hypothetical protein TWF696_003491 [Orbilia brochopaga]|uniref:Uncharacterized protein n=1 Tax=Orbilia brochopaga TaxID=3140254 RepID=A0AAV9TWN4_9PEZI
MASSMPAPVPAPTAPLLGPIRVCIEDDIGRFYTELTPVHFNRMSHVEQYVREHLLHRPDQELVIPCYGLTRNAIFDVFDYCNHGILRPHAYRRAFTKEERKETLQAINHLGCWGLKHHLLSFWMSISYGIHEKLETISLFVEHGNEAELRLRPYPFIFQILSALMTHEDLYGSPFLGALEQENPSVGLRLYRLLRENHVLRTQAGDKVVSP